MEISERALRSIEQIQEDERLRGDLEDRAATALVAWASALATSIADDPQRSDSEVETAVQAIRRAARAASHSGANEPEQVVAAAEAITRHTYADILTPTSPDTDSQQPEQSSAETQASTLAQAKRIQQAEHSEQETNDQQAEPSQHQGLVHSLLQRLKKPESQDS